VLETILIDTGPLIALFDKDDAYHQAVTDFIRAKPYRFISSTAVLTEVLHMLDFNVAVQISFLEWITKDGILIHDIQQSDLSQIMLLTQKYRDRPMDFADATLLVIAQKTGVNKIISLDADFDIYRLANKLRLENVFNYRL
jgi:uncharacterized protein